MVFCQVPLAKIAVFLYDLRVLIVIPIVMAILGLFGKSSVEKEFKPVIVAINALEPEIKALSDADLKAESKKLQFLLAEVSDDKKKEKLDELLPRAFALVREAARRTLGQRHYDVQLMGGYALHNGSIAEMRTGEGKTLVATLPTYLNALVGKGMHVVTVNEYLAKRDAVWMGQVYATLGLSVACLVHSGALVYDPTFKPNAKENQPNPENPLKEGGLVDKERDTTGSFLVQTEYLRPVPRQGAYKADITYGTNHEFGFDYLRDNLVGSLEQQVQSNRYMALIDEVDSILIDEARTPLIIAAPDQQSSENYKLFNRIVGRLEKDTHYIVDEKKKSVDITPEGIDKVEEMAGIKNIYSAENIRLTHYLQECLRAHGLYLLDRDYVVKNGEVIIVDQFTGRMMIGRRYNGGLHQAIEAKEGVSVREESRTYGQISIQNYFRLYERLAGMTGTAQTSAEEFHKVYGIEVVTIPTNRAMVRQDEKDLIYKSVDAKYNAIIEDVKQRHAKGQPVLIGTVSIEKNEELGRRLVRAGLPHEVLNAKNNEREGSIIAQAGKPGAITVATNMAGRGVDIILGGNPPEVLNQQKVREAGGLHVIGTERHESRRIDNQLRGRAGRQGDPGSSQFFLSVEDDLVRVFGGDRIKSMMERLNLPEDMPIQAGILNKAVEQAQSKVEGHNFDARKHLLDYDDVLNKQRLAIYKKRQDLLQQHVVTPILGMLDMLWMTHLEDMEALAESVRLRAVGQHDPLVEYRREGHQLYQQMLANFDQWLAENKEKLEELAKQQAVHLASPEHAGHSHAPTTAKIVDNLAAPAAIGDSSQQTVNSGQKIGRNDPCYCGSGKKYKKCHGQ
jgi:preprotein translocase subunit SecA